MVVVGPTARPAVPTISSGFSRCPAYEESVCMLLERERAGPAGLLEPVGLMDLLLVVVVLVCFWSSLLGHEGSLGVSARLENNGTVVGGSTVYYDVLGSLFSPYAPEGTLRCGRQEEKKQGHGLGNCVPNITMIQVRSTLRWCCHLLWRHSPHIVHPLCILSMPSMLLARNHVPRDRPVNVDDPELTTDSHPHPLFGATLTTKVRTSSTRTVRSMGETA